MRIAVQGCSHGELDKIYESIVQSEKQTGEKVDLLICCGDFQACRNEYDLSNMKCPKKHAHMGTFWEYYSGRKTAACLTIFIGGNHEASNHLWELYYGGWVAPRIYYLGSAGIINVGGLRIGGVSGIYKKYDYHKGHHEVPPFTQKDICSVYHIRSIEVMRCKSIKQHVDIFLSHDWPLGVYDYGDKESLIRFKPYFEDEINSHELGSPPAAEIMEALQPSYWFAGHLHVKFSAVIPHDEFGKTTRFLALDKCLPKRRFLQILDIGEKLCAPPILEYDPEWLAILVVTEGFYNPLNEDQKLPTFVELPEDLTDRVKTRFGSMIIPENFSITAPPHTPGGPRDYVAVVHPQSKEFCVKLGIKNECVPDTSKTAHSIDLDITHDSDANTTFDTSALNRSFLNCSTASIGGTPKQCIPPPDDDGEQSGNMMFNLDFTAPDIKPQPEPTKTASSVEKNAATPQPSQNNCSTPRIITRRLTLPPPKHTPIPLSPIKPTTPKPTTPKPTTPEPTTPKPTTPKPTTPKPTTPEPTTPKPTTPKQSDNSEPTDTKTLVDPTESPVTPSNSLDDHDFDLDDSDDNLISKFLSLKKRFGRAQTSDSMLGNTSIRDVLDDECNIEDDTAVPNKKFKMEIHNNLDE